jgi:hypothetical protein
MLLRDGAPLPTRRGWASSDVNVAAAATAAGANLGPDLHVMLLLDTSMWNERTVGALIDRAD